MRNTITKKNSIKWKTRNFLNALKVAWAITLISLLGNEVSAQSNTVRDNATQQIEQTLKISSKSGYGNIIKQRNIILESYSMEGRNVYQDFINTQKWDFLKDYKNNNYNINSYVNQIKIILSSEFNIDVQGNDPIQIISKALQVIANEEYEWLLWYYTQNLSWDFDMNFINAYWYIQAQLPSAWVQINGVYMPNWELDWESGAKTLQYIIKKLNNWSYWVMPETTNFHNTWNNNQNSGHITTNSNQNTAKPTQNTAKPTQNTVPWNSGNNQWAKPTVNSSNDIDLDDDPAPTKVSTRTSSPEVKPEPKKTTVEPTTPPQKTNIVPEKKNNVTPTKLEPEEKKQEKKEEVKPTVKPVENKSNKVNNGDIDLDLTPDMFYDENLELVKSMSWDANILSKKLSSSKLNGISYIQVVNTVNWFKDQNLQKAVMYALLNNDVITAQNLLWMSVDCNDYQNYKAWNRLWSTELQRMANLWKTRTYLDENEIMWNSNIPWDVKAVYKKFVSGEISNNWRAYSIVSKDDYKIYLFSVDHHLLASQNVLLGADKWDQKNNPFAWSQTTPGWKYEIWNRFTSNGNKNFFAEYGSHYIVLLPSDWQYDYSTKYTMWIHGDYKWSPNRKAKLYSANSIDHRASNGCINVDSALFGEIYNHLETGWVIYVAYE